jgi:hypothetical protein
MPRFRGIGFWGIWDEAVSGYLFLNGATSALIGREIRDETMGCGYRVTFTINSMIHLLKVVNVIISQSKEI